MRWSVPAGVLVALAFLVPAAQAVAEPGSPVLNQACQPVERKVYKDIRELVTIDLDTASDIDVRVLANQILSVARAESLTGLPARIQERLDGTAADLRAFLKTNLVKAWSTDLRVAVAQTLTGAGPHVNAAAQTALDEGTIDGYLAYLNDGLYAARVLDCAAQATPTPKPGATKTAAAIPTPAAGSHASGGKGGGLAVTGTNTAAVAGIGGALLLLGGAGYLIGRRRRSRFVA